MNEEKLEEKPKVKSKGKSKSIKPLKDFKCQFNDLILDLKKGEESLVPEELLSNLKTEKVIK